jgi:hypothetical protein
MWMARRSGWRCATSASSGGNETMLLLLLLLLLLFCYFMCPQVQYVDGEQEWLALRNEVVIWRLPPKDDSSDEGSSGDEDEDMLLQSDGEAGSLQLQRRRKHRVSAVQGHSCCSVCSLGVARHAVCRVLYFCTLVLHVVCKQLSVLCCLSRWVELV